MIILKCGSRLTQEDIPLGTLLGCKAGKGDIRDIGCPKAKNKYCLEISCFSDERI